MWNELYSACAENKRRRGQSIRAFLSLAKSFCYQLTMHHTIEERHLFPELAVRMPEFRKELSLLSQHHEIHQGLEKLKAYVTKCRTGETELQLTHMKALMDNFGGVLWAHLNDEVMALGAENMRKYWNLHEMALLYR